MGDDTGYRVLLRRSLAALAGCAVAVAVCYRFVDRPVAFAVRDHGVSHTPGLVWLTVPPAALQLWTPAVLVLLAVRRAAFPGRRWATAVLAAFVALLVADQFKQSLALVFGRTWPDTWINGNPSLFRDGVYGFHPFHGGDGYKCFPSGHTARAATVAAVVWVGYPRWRGAAVLWVFSVVVGLIGMGYHFVGDVVAGGTIGTVVGAYAAHVCGIRTPAP